jgi:hypothetical protein
VLAETPPGTLPQRRSATVPVLGLLPAEQLLARSLS